MVIKNVILFLFIKHPKRWQRAQLYGSAKHFNFHYLLDLISFQTRIHSEQSCKHAVKFHKSGPYNLESMMFDADDVFDSSCSFY